MPTVEELLAEQEIMREQYDNTIKQLQESMTGLTKTVADLESQQSENLGNQLREEVNRLTNATVFGESEEATKQLRETHVKVVLARLTADVAQGKALDPASAHGGVFKEITSQLRGFSPAGGPGATAFKQETPVSAFQKAVDDTLHGTKYDSLDEYLKQDNM